MKACEEACETRKTAMLTSEEIAAKVKSGEMDHEEAWQAL